jgi:hypothetical protein
MTVNVKLEWLQPLRLGKLSDRHLDRAQSDLGSLSDAYRMPGVYVLGRQWGDTFTPVYIGQSQNMASRVKSHIDKISMIRALRKAGTGEKFVLFGRFRAKRGQVEKTCLEIAEKALIRFALGEGHELWNKSGTKMKAHTVTSSGNRMFGVAFDRHIHVQTN